MGTLVNIMSGIALILVCLYVAVKALGNVRLNQTLKRRKLEIDLWHKEKDGK